jgi:hypothetical protein
LAKRLLMTAFRAGQESVVSPIDTQGS